MSKETGKYLKFGGATVIILLVLGYLAYTGVQESKSYYVTIKELHGMGDSAYTKRLRVAGNVQPGSIKRIGTKVEFLLVENDQVLPVVYSGTEAPPDTFKDNSQALADGRVQWDRRGRSAVGILINGGHGFPKCVVRGAGFGCQGELDCTMR